MATAIFQFFRRKPIRKAPKLFPKHTFEGHQGAIQTFVFLQDNVHIVSGSKDGTMCKWNCETGQLVGEPWKVEDPVLALALSPDGKTIACGRSDGSVQRWDTNGQMMEDVWTGDSYGVWSLSWSPSRGHLASGSEDGTILVRNVESRGGAVEVGPIKTNQGPVWSVAYSPSGDRIASGGISNAICIWDSHTGELLVGPIKDLGGAIHDVTSVVWSSDGNKLYSASDKFAGVFNGTSGTVLHRFQNDDPVYSIALSPKHNLLACVGFEGTVQLWDTESHQPFHVPFPNKEDRNLFHVSFSADGRYLAYGGENKITLWTVEHSAEPLVPASSTILQGGMQQHTLPKSQSSSSPNVDDTNILSQSAVNDDQGRNDPYDQFFVPSHSSLPSPLPNPSPRRRFRHVRAVDQDKEHDNINSSENVVPAQRGNDQGKQRKLIAHIQVSSPDVRSSPAESARPSAAHAPSHRSQHPRPSTARRVWNMISSSRHRPLCTEPQPVTVYAARPKKLYWRVPRRADKQANANANTDANANKIAHAQAVPSPSARGQPSAVQPESGPYRMQSSQTQAAIQPTHGQYDYGCWRNVYHSLWCIRLSTSVDLLPEAAS